MAPKARAGRQGGGQSRGCDEDQAGGSGGSKVPQFTGNFPTNLRANVNALYLKVVSEDEDYSVLEKWPKTYAKLIKEFRKAMAPEEFCYVGNQPIHMMSANPPEELFNLVLYYDADNWVILLYNRTSDMYLVGFRNTNGSFGCNDTHYPGFSTLRFGTDYGSLATNSDSDMCTINLGMYRLGLVVKHLGEIDAKLSRDSKKNVNIAAAILLSVLKFAESSRFECIFTNIMQNLGDMSYFSLLPYHEFYINNWSKLSKVLVAAKENENMVQTINHAISEGLHGLGDEKSRRGFLLPNGEYATNVEDVKSVVRVVSRQSVDDSVRLFGPQG